MIDSIQIKNFKNLDGLHIKKFARVNLLTGKNNSGKTSLLEAIGLNIKDGSFNFLQEISEKRGLDTIYDIPNVQNGYAEKRLLDFFKYLVTNREVQFGLGKGIKITCSEVKPNRDKDFDLEIDLIEYVEEKEYIEDSTRTKKIFREDLPKNHSYSNFFKAFYLKTNDYNTLLPLDNTIFKFNGFSWDRNGKPVTFIGSNEIYSDNAVFAWNLISLTEKELYVLDALKIVSPNIEKFSFWFGISDSARTPKPYVKLKEYPNIVPLRTFGDGTNRLFHIVLNLVVSQNGILLIDEIENGLHYSIQEKLWEIIFDLAEKLDVQVFATTHSDDTVERFTSVVNKKGNEEKGRLFVLYNKDGKAKALEYDARDMRIAVEQEIEIR